MDKNLPRVADCIRAVKAAGWTFSHYNRPFYVFTRAGVTVTFTLTEIRDAYRHGW